MSEKDNNEIQKIKSLTIKIVKEKKPETIRQLITFVKKEIDIEIPEKKLFLIIQELEEEKKLQFDELFFPESVIEYIFSFRALWYWIVLLLSILSVLFIFAIPDNLVPLIYARSFLGLLFVLYLPGYAIIKTIYPISVPMELHSIILDNIERIALSVGLSFAVTPFVGLILYFTPWGVNLVLITLSLLAITTVFATSAVRREYQARKALFLRRLIIVSKYELSDYSVKFYEVAGLFKNRLTLVREMPIKEITSVGNFGNELSITSNGVTDIFFLKYDSHSVTKLCEKIQSMQ